MSNSPEDKSADPAAADVSGATEAPADSVPESGEPVASGDGAEVAEPGSVEELERKLQEAQQEQKDTYDRLLRATADLDNFRKRSRREVEDARIEARARILRDVLPVLDNLERAVTHAASTADEGAQVIVDGVKLVLRQFEQALAKNDVKVIEAEGKPFDPNLHEAMSQLETPDIPPGGVVQVLQAGYMIGDRLLRPALVVVAKAPAEPAAGPNGKSATAGESTESNQGDDV